jgi:UDP-glucuronate 4-epimerase
MSILITGAAGFIGFHTARALKTARVFGLDNFNPYYSVELKRKRAALLREEGIEIIEGDIRDKSKLLELFDAHSITHVIHLAAQAGVRYSLQHPEAYVQANIEGFLSILEAVRAYPHIKLIYASSSSVYGLNEKIPFATSDRTDHPASFYGVTKKTNELMAAAYHHLFQLDVCGLRFFTVYGPWGRPDMAYFSFTESIVENRPIDLYHQGKCERDFTYIDDIVEGIKGSLQLPRGHHLFNLGNHRPVKLSYFVEILENLLGKKAQVRSLPLQSGDIVATWADIEESQKRLGFYPKVSIEEGLARFVEWYKECYPKKS